MIYKMVYYLEMILNFADSVILLEAISNTER